MSACIGAAQELVLDQQAYRRKGKKHVQGRSWDKLMQIKSLEPMDYKWSVMYPHHLESFSVDCTCCRGKHLLEELHKPADSTVGNSEGFDITERKKSSLLILLQKLQQAYGKWAKFFLIYVKAIVHPDGP